MAFFSARSALDQRAAADDDVAAGFVDLQHQALDRAADVVADVGRTADVDLAGGQEDVDADIDQQAALDLARDRAGDDVAFVDRFHDLQPGFDLLGFALAEARSCRGIFDQAVASSTSSIRTLTIWPSSGGSSSSSHSLSGMVPSLL